MIRLSLFIGFLSLLEIEAKGTCGPLEIAFQRHQAIEWSPGQVEYIRDGEVVFFDVSNRGLGWFKDQKLVPDYFYDVGKLKGKRVLDAPTGGGQFVLDLRDAGIEAIGVDIVHNDNTYYRNSGKMYRKTDFEFFLEADMAFLPEGIGKFDVIYCNHFWFRKMPYEAKLQIMNSLTDHLSVGGTIRINRGAFAGDLINVIDSIPNLEIVSPSDFREKGVSSYYFDYLELRRKS